MNIITRASLNAFKLAIKTGNCRKALQQYVADATVVSKVTVAHLRWLAIQEYYGNLNMHQPEIRRAIELVYSEEMNKALHK